MIQPAQPVTIALSSDNRTHVSVAGFILNNGLTSVYAKSDWTTSLVQ